MRSLGLCSTIKTTQTNIFSSTFMIATALTTKRDFADIIDVSRGGVKIFHRYLDCVTDLMYNLLFYYFEWRWVSIMSRVCQITGKRPMSGNNVSHAHNKTRRRFLPNLHRRRFWVSSKKRWITLSISRQGLRIIDKKGIDALLPDLRKRGVKI